MAENGVEDQGPSTSTRHTRRNAAASAAATTGRARSPAISDEEDEIGPELRRHMDPETGLIHGRSPAMVRYLIMKAKYGYALQQHEERLENLRLLRGEEKREREARDMALDNVLRMMGWPWQK